MKRNAYVYALSNASLIPTAPHVLSVSHRMQLRDHAESKEHNEKARPQRQNVW